MVDFFLGHIPDFFWGIAAFIVFVLFLFKVGLRPVLAAVDAREARIRKDLAEAEQAAVEAKLQRAANELERKAHEAKIAEAMAEIRRDAEEHKSKLVEQGRVEIEAMRIRALREIEAARHAAVVSLRTQISEVAVLVAEKAIGERLDVAKHESLIEAAVARFDAQNA
jgi:F-type H+-transporting ATPase subunit b